MATCKKPSTLLICAVFANVLGSARVQAEISAFRGSVRTTVQERIDGQAASFNESTDEYALSRGATPIDAGAELTSTHLDDVLIASGQGYCLLNDPRIPEGENPAEYELEVGCFSNSPRMAYTVTSFAGQTRRIVFGPTVPGTTSVFRPATGQQIESTIFLGGTVLFWSTLPSGSLRDTHASIVVTVRDSRRVLVDPSVLSLRLVFEGDELGQVDSSVVSNRPGSSPILFEVHDLTALRALADSDEAAAALVAQADVLGLDTLVAVLIPWQRLRYTYDLRLNAAFELTADFELSVRNGPQGSGVAAVMGRPFDVLEELLEQSVTGIDGRLVQESVNILARHATGATGGANEAASPYPGGSLCGALGPASVGAIGLWLSWCWFLGLERRRRADR